MNATTVAVSCTVLCGHVVCDDTRGLHRALLTLAGNFVQAASRSSSVVEIHDPLDQDAPRGSMRKLCSDPRSIAWVPMTQEFLQRQEDMGRASQRLAVERTSLIAGCRPADDPVASGHISECVKEL